MATPRQTLDDLIDLFTPTIRDAFIASIQDVTDNVILTDVIKAIEAGDVEAAFRALGYSDAAMRPLTVEIEKAFETGGVLTGQSFPKYINTTNGRGVFRFDVRNSRAEAWLRDNSSQLITRIGDDARVNVMNVMTEGMKRGQNPRRTAIDIIGVYDPRKKHRVGGIVGLDQRREMWIRNTRTDLENLDEHYFTRKTRDQSFDRLVAKAIADKKPLSKDDIDKLVTRAKDIALKQRGDAIARTESIAALNRSEWEATKQAIDLGAAKESAVKREWDDTGDRRTRYSHVKMRHQQVGLDEPFVSPVSGAKMMFPGDTSLGAPAKETVNCRCRVKTVIDWLADIE